MVEAPFIRLLIALVGHRKLSEALHGQKKPGMGSALGSAPPFSCFEAGASALSPKPSMIFNSTALQGKGLGA